MAKRTRREGIANNVDLQLFGASLGIEKLADTFGGSSEAVELMLVKRRLERVRHVVRRHMNSKDREATS